jgi:hypothetical protein
MKLNPYQIGSTLLAVLLMAVASAFAAQGEKSDDSAPRGVLELECNISRVNLYLCPRNKYVRKTIERFFGLIKSHEESCSDSVFFLGATPLKPITLPAGQYILLIPLGYTWEHEGPVEINIKADEKLFFLLKLFSHDNPRGEGSGGSSGGSGIGGAPGTPPP